MTSQPAADDLPERARRIVTYGGSGYAEPSIVSSSFVLGPLA